MLPHPLTNFEIQKYYQNKHKFSGVYSRNNLPKIKGWGISIGTHWIDSYLNGNIRILLYIIF